MLIYACIHVSGELERLHCFMDITIYLLFLLESEKYLTFKNIVVLLP